ncbi:type II toxin-antitoxin system RelE/ParE family toxin [Rugamonas sp. FT107W]|uniref:Type II toxin-antitoxin system RelE/ParE family toxin n=1 Tax=Duganella vulcania TaxID=2692166 RepID=A0A845HFE3_9BURK|nr:type II toxin-antitoxin system RelE/ParE family toxin [Duganella vulcania]MYN16103.1 type II toxin-antitoxin system RelE/ParE family toxin [Duganella vulcania]
MRELVRTATYRADLDDIERYIARDNPVAAARLCDLIDDQADQLADPNFPRRRGRVKGTFELVVHKHYVVVFTDDQTTVTLLNVIHSSRKYP